MKKVQYILANVMLVVVLLFVACSSPTLTPTPAEPLPPVKDTPPTSPAPPETSLPDTSTLPVKYDMPRGTTDPDITVDVYVPEKVWPGTTLLADLHVVGRPRIIEINLRGEIVWEYLVPAGLA